MLPDAPLGALRAAMRTALADSGAPDPHFDADQILSRVLARPRAYLHTHPEDRPSPPQLSRIDELTERRRSGEPLAYVLGDAIFGGRSFFVDGRALIPRPETEVLTEWASARMKQMKTLSGGVFADWCTGSGCIALTLLLENPEWRAFAVDVSRGALDVAKKNAEALGVGDRVRFLLCGQPDEAASAIDPGSLDLIAANPPYIPSDAVAGLEPQVRRYEPREALDGGRDGLGVCRMLLTGLPRYMKPGAPMAFETGGPGQARLLAAEDAGGAAFEGTFADLRGIRRFVVWRKPA